MKKTSQFKIRSLAFLMAILTIFTILGGTTAMAASSDDSREPEVHTRTIGGSGAGQYYALQSNITVYSNTAYTIPKGTIYQYEGFTVLSANTWYLEVEYSSSSGTKTGYIAKSSPDEFILPDSCVAKVDSTSTLYYGPSTTANPIAGTVYADELVTVLAKNDNWVYVEYNTTLGRKRGYMSYSNLTCYDRPSVFPDLYTHNNAGETHYYSGRHDIYAGPSKTYAKVGFIEDENVTIYDDFDYYGYGYGTSCYVEYNVWVGGQMLRKSGWVVFDD